MSVQVKLKIKNVIERIASRCRLKFAAAYWKKNVFLFLFLKVLFNNTLIRHKKHSIPSQLL
jgi:hypothetical protein